jgi:hypothetical protein
MPDIDFLAEKFVSGQPSGCPYLDELAERVRLGDIDISEMKAVMRNSLNEVI